MTQLMTFVNAIPGNISQGLIWGILAIGVYITYKILDFADLTVDGSMATGGAVCVMLITNNDWSCPVWLAIVCAFAASILTQMALYSINLDIMGQSNRPVSVDKYPLVLSSREVSVIGNEPITIILAIVKIFVIVAAIVAAQRTATRIWRERRA